jgi:hypothetical protein
MSNHRTAIQRSSRENVSPSSSFFSTSAARNAQRFISAFEWSRASHAHLRDEPTITPPIVPAAVLSRSTDACAMQESPDRTNRRAYQTRGIAQHPFLFSLFTIVL